MRKFVCVTLVLALAGTVAAMAQAPQISQAKRDREALMRSNNNAMRALMPLVAGFDAAAAKAQGQILVENGGRMAAQYAPGTDQNDNEVQPVTWTDTAGFKAAADKFTADAAMIGAAADGPALQAAIQAVNADCNACHRTYRLQAARGRGGPPAPPAQ